MKIVGATCGVMMAVFSGSSAKADDFCARMRALLTDPPSGFVALRGERMSAIWPRWNSKPFLEGASCEITGSDDGPNSELRCIVNDKSTADVANSFYESTSQAIDSCLAELPHGRDFVRANQSKGADGFEGVTTNWSYHGRGQRIDIGLSNDRVFGHARNTVMVKYSKG